MGRQRDRIQLSAEHPPQFLEALFAQLEPFTGGLYDNIDFDDEDPAGKNYGPAHPRLVEIKKRYDSGNLFRLNRNIKPA